MQHPFRSAAMTLNLLAAVLGFLRPASAGPAPTKWACIGNSITQGSNGPSYTAKLAELLGNEYLVENDGVSGTTLLKRGDNPYWKNGKLANVFAFKPDIISIKLGTNDSKAWNWKYGSEFEADLNALIDTLAAMPSKPRIFLALPCPAFANPFAIDDAVISGSIIPVIRKVASARGLGLIDANTPLRGHPEWFGDGVHPNSGGAAAIAAAFHRAVAAQDSPTEPPYRVHCGGGKIADPAGNTWWPDAAYARGGSLSAFTDTVDGTDFPQLFGSERWDDSFGEGMAFAFPVSDARRYRVRLHFAEMHKPSAAVGARLFGIRVNGAPLADSLDLFKEAGFAKPLVRETILQAAEGAISIGFRSIKDAAKINGIEILPADGTGIGNPDPARPVRELKAWTPGPGSLSVRLSGSARVTLSDLNGRVRAVRTGPGPALFTALRAGIYVLVAQPAQGAPQTRIIAVP